MIHIHRSRTWHWCVNIVGLDTRLGCRYDQNSPPPLFNVSLGIYIYEVLRALAALDCLIKAPGTAWERLQLRYDLGHPKQAFREH